MIIFLIGFEEETGRKVVGHWALKDNSLTFKSNKSGLSFIYSNLAYIGIVYLKKMAEGSRL